MWIVIDRAHTHLLQELEARLPLRNVPFSLSRAVVSVEELPIRSYALGGIDRRADRHRRCKRRLPPLQAPLATAAAAAAALLWLIFVYACVSSLYFLNIIPLHTSWKAVASVLAQLLLSAGAIIY